MTDLGDGGTLHIGDQSTTEIAQAQLVIGILQDTVGLRQGAATVPTLGDESFSQATVPALIGTESVPVASQNFER